jgi:hypothetical protein
MGGIPACGVWTMPDYPALYGASAWALMRESINFSRGSRPPRMSVQHAKSDQTVRDLYEPTTELPPRLLALLRQLSGVEHGLVPKEFPTALLTLVQKLDALEGDQLLRRCGQRLRDLPEKPLPD